MRKIFVVIAVTIFLFSCEQKSIIEKAVEEIPLEIKVECFDKAFFETSQLICLNLNNNIHFSFQLETKMLFG